MKDRNLSKDALLGFAVGDAFGVPVEFLTREEVRAVHLTEMSGKEDHLNFNSWWGSRIPAGAWSDDTSMTIAAMDTIRRNHGEIDYEAIMQSFLAWWNEGKYSSLGIPFGLGCTVEEAFQRYEKGRPAPECGGTDVYDNGNGALMRILPFSIYCIMKNLPERETAELIGKASSLTHGHDISKMSCFIYTEFLRELYQSGKLQSAYGHIMKINYHEYFSEEAVNAHEKILNPAFPESADEDISEKNGYVVATLETALHSLLTTNNYEEALLKAVNMGYDTDTVGGVTGGLAGALYGYESIPKRWLDKLLKRTYLERLAEAYQDLFI